MCNRKQRGDDSAGAISGKNKRSEISSLVLECSWVHHADGRHGRHGSQGTENSGRGVWEVKVQRREGSGAKGSRQGSGPGAGRTTESKAEMRFKNLGVAVPSRQKRSLSGS